MARGPAASGGWAGARLAASALGALALLAGCGRGQAPGEGHEAAAQGQGSAAPQPLPPKGEAAGGFKPIGGVEGQNPAYDRSRQPARVVAALGLRPGQRVADLGAGLGYLTFRLAEAVGPAGRVVATDVDDDAIEGLRARAASAPNVSVRKVRPDDPGLEPGSYDLVLMSEVDHFLADRVAFLTKLRAALAPSGRVAVTHVRALRAPLVEAAEQAGYKVAEGLEGLPDHYLVFLQPASSQ